MTDNFTTNPQFDQVASPLEQDHGLPPGTLRAVALQESGGDPNARSSDGGVGLMQFTDPNIIKKYNVDPTDPWDSLRGAAEYLGDNIQKYGSLRPALGDYNGGPPAAKAILAGQPSPYVDGVMSKMPPIQPQQPPPGAPQPPPGVQPPPPGTTPAQGPSIDDQKALLAQQVTEDVQNGTGPITILSGLLKTNLAGADIAAALKRGVTPEQIINTVGGQPLADFQKNDPNWQEQHASVWQDGLNGIKDGIDSLMAGTKQLYHRATGDDAGLAQDQADESALQSSPTQQARNQSTVYKVAKGFVENAPVIASAILAPETLVARGLLGAGAGLVQGSLQPTTGPDQIGSNMATNAAEGAFVNVLPTVGKAAIASAPVQKVLQKIAATQSPTANQLVYAGARALHGDFAPTAMIAGKKAIGWGAGKLLTTAGEDEAPTLAEQVSKGLDTSSDATAPTPTITGAGASPPTPTAPPSNMAPSSVQLMAQRDDPDNASLAASILKRMRSGVIPAGIQMAAPKRGPVYQR
jgi:hypothetical protein